MKRMVHLFPIFARHIWNNENERRSENLVIVFIFFSSASPNSELMNWWIDFAFAQFSDHGFFMNFDFDLNLLYEMTFKFNFYDFSIRFSEYGTRNNWKYCLMHHIKLYNNQCLFLCLYNRHIQWALAPRGIKILNVLDALFLVALFLYKNGMHKVNQSSIT